MRETLINTLNVQAILFVALMGAFLLCAIVDKHLNDRRGIIPRIGFVIALATAIVGILTLLTVIELLTL